MERYAGLIHPARNNDGTPRWSRLTDEDGEPQKSYHVTVDYVWYPKTKTGSKKRRTAHLDVDEGSNTWRDGTVWFPARVYGETADDDDDDDGTTLSYFHALRKMRRKQYFLEKKAT